MADLIVRTEDSQCLNPCKTGPQFDGSDSKHRLRNLS